MKIGKSIYYFPSKKTRKYSFEKMISGKRFSRHFTTEAAVRKYAQSFALNHHEKGAGALFFGLDDRKLLGQIRKICGDFDPIEAVKFWRDHYNASVTKAPDMESCWVEFLGWLEKSGRSEAHIHSIRSTRNRFLERFRDCELAKITKQDILEWLLSGSKLSARSRRNLWINTRNFLSWCKSAKSWLVDIPTIDDRLLPKETQNPVAIWTFKEFEKAFRWIEKNVPDCVPHYALRAFAGLRTSEASQMRWEWIDFEHKTITVPAHICKTRDAWILLPEFLPDTIFRWLAPWKKKSGGIKRPSDTTREKVSRACKWKQNVLRHTFATMHVARFHDEGKTILATRHTNIATLRANYRGVNQPQADAEKFFALRPRK